MDFTLQEIALIVLVGIIAGLLPGTIAERRGIRLAGDIAVGVAGVFAAAWLMAAWRDLVPFSLTTPAGKPPEKVSVDINIPNYEPVVFPLAPLKPLLKPVVFRSREEICDTLVRAAQNNDLPVPFFIRLLYQESTFRPAAISSAGALGIAQFMPETAAHRRLDNPFDPAQAIPASARLLRDHYRRYGNLGLAAAAYNAGPRRVDDWRAKKGPLPQETQDYVRVITGFPVETWTAPMAGGPAVKLQQGAPCQDAAGLLAWDGPDEIPMPVPSPRVVEAKAAAVAAREAAKAKKNAKAAVTKKQEAAQEAKQDAKADAKQNGVKKPETKQDAKTQDLKQDVKEEDAKKPEVKEPDSGTAKRDAKVQDGKEQSKNGKDKKDSGATAGRAPQGSDVVRQ
ncbi:MAG TPA: lytic transglycosylase domain-containing protein [Pseudolabrys sp.]|nr:lytic transglycosylase domain-containing protein [Pseudolabrys sp.]